MNNRNNEYYCIASNTQLAEYYHFPFDLVQIIVYANTLLAKALDQARKFDNFRGNDGGYLTCIGGITGRRIFTIRLGNVFTSDKRIFNFMSQAHAQILFDARNGGKTENRINTSYQCGVSLDCNCEGAVYMNTGYQHYIFSFYGLPEFYNEAIMCVLIEKLVEDHAKGIAQFGLKERIDAFDRNPYIERLSIL